MVSSIIYPVSSHKEHSKLGVKKEEFRLREDRISSFSFLRTSIFSSKFLTEVILLQLRIFLAVSIPKIFNSSSISFKRGCKENKSPFRFSKLRKEEERFCSYSFKSIFGRAEVLNFDEAQFIF